MVVDAVDSTLWFSIGAVAMLAGAGVFAAKIKTGSEENRDYYVVLTFIAFIASLSYVALATGVGILEVEGGANIHIARYVDWIITTPLILLLFALLANASIKEWSVVAALDVLMIMTGAVGSFDTGATKYIWFVASCGMMFFLFYYLFGRVTKAAKDERPAIRSLFALLRNYIAAIWIAYPVVWVLAPTGEGILTPLGADIAFMILDVITKVGIGVIVIYSGEALRDLAERGSQRRTRKSRTPGGAEPGDG
jgi:sensory rhodopsin